MHCAISKVHPAMHQCTDAPHTRSASSQNCIAELFTKMSSSHREHPQNYFASAPSDHQPYIALSSSAPRGGGQDDESSFWLKFCNGPGRPSQDGRAKNLHCNIAGCFITRIFTIGNIIIRPQIIIDESLSVTRCDKICDYIRSETIHREVEYCENCYLRKGCLNW